MDPAMRKLLAFAIGILFCCFLRAQPGSPSLSGKITDSSTGKPLAGVSVYLNNTSRGTVTKSDGSFLLANLPAGTYQLIFSAIGYQTWVIDIDGSHPPPALHIALHSKATELTAVTIEPYDKH